MATTNYGQGKFPDSQIKFQDNQIKFQDCKIVVPPEQRPFGPSTINSLEGIKVELFELTGRLSEVHASLDDTLNAFWGMAPSPLPTVPTVPTAAEATPQPSCTVDRIRYEIERIGTQLQVAQAITATLGVTVNTLRSSLLGGG